MNRRTFLAATTSLATVTVLSLSAHPVIEFYPFSNPDQSSVSLDRSRLLDCLAQVESGRNDMATARRNGKLVALGRYQITEPVWFQHTNRPWKLAHNFHFATIVAERHLMWLEKHCPEPNPFWLSVGWRHGLSVASSLYHQIPYAWDYAYRVTNLYYESRT